MAEIGCGVCNGLPGKMSCSMCRGTGCLGVPTGAWESGPESWPGTESLDDVIRRVMPSPEEHAEQAQQLRNEQYAKAGLPMPGTAAKGALRHLISGPRRHGLSSHLAALGIDSAIHAAMEAERSKAIEQALKPGALPEPFGALNLTEWTAAMLADWQDATITSEELLTLLDEMLDRTVHSDACHIDPDDTVCVCVIGQLRSVLPPCTVEYPLVPGDAKLWHCTRKAHPASPDRHVWSNR